MNDRLLRIGVAGLGRAFSLMLPTFLGDPRISLVAACDPRDEARVRFENDFSAPTYRDIEQLVRDPAVDIVYCASPHQYHADHTRAASQHGKHVLVEKPMALTLSDCDAMIEACRAAGVYLIVGHCHSFDTPYLRARELIDSGVVGRVKMIHAFNYTDFLYRPRRAEELNTGEGGGVVFSQAAHQVDVVRLLAGSRANRVRAATGVWDASRPTEGAYTALLWFEDEVFASLTYSGYAHFDSDEWCGWIGEMGQFKRASDYGSARRRLRTVNSASEEAKLKAAGTYGGATWKSPMSRDEHAPTPLHQHFGPVTVTCELADVRPTPDALWVYGDDTCERRALPLPHVPRFEVIDELYSAVVHGKSPLHDGHWARTTLEICLALLQSARERRDVEVGR